MTDAGAADGPRTVADLVTGPVTIGVPVRDFDTALAFHRSWLGREPDLVPQPGMAEWTIVDGCDLQLYASAAAGGHAVVRLGVDDIEAARAAAVVVGVQVSQIEDVGGFIRFAEFRDPEGNAFGFVQELG